VQADRIEDTDPTCRAVCEASEAIVVSVEYRLAPEHPFLAGLRDCYAATAWADRNAETIGGLDGGVAVGGTSAGATLSAGVSLMARDFAQVGEAGVPDIAFQWLVYPAANTRETFDSYSENGKGYFLERETSRWFRDQYYERPTDRFHPYAAPLEARDVSGLPPATVVTAEFDPLRNEGRAHAERMRDAGVEVTHRHYDGMIHGFVGMLGLSASADCIEAVSGDLRETMVHDE
jgi:acetyl esterase